MRAVPYNRRRGVTVMEMLVGVAIMMTMLTLAMSGYVRLARGERRGSAQARLDMDVRKAIEMLREHLRLTTVDRILLYPAGVGPYTAISFPAASDNNGDGMIDLAPGGTNVVWDRTVIYHVWPGSPSQLLRTTFRPRNNTLSDAQRVEQFRLVVERADHGSTFTLEPYEATQVVFANLFTWKLTVGARPINGYDTYLHPEETAFGAAVLTPGNHTLRFKTTAPGAGGGYKIGMDVLRASASGSDREAEEQTFAAVGATARNNDYQSSGAWSGNRQLVLDATGTNQALDVTLRNDEWEESNFNRGGTFDRTVVHFVDLDKDNELLLGGNGDTWLAAQQTRADQSSVSVDLRGTCVRVLVRGTAMPDGGAILQSGSLIRAPSYCPPEMRCLEFRLPPAMKLGDDPSYPNNWWATIARVPGSNYTAAVDSSATGFRWIYIPKVQTSDGLVYGYYPDWAYGTHYDVLRTNNYAVTFWVQKNNDSQPVPAWTEQNAGAPGCYVALAPTNTSPWTLMSQSWTASTPGFAVHSNLYVLERIVTGFASSGTFESQVFDTGKDSPAYDTTTWDAFVPSGCGLSLAFRSGGTEDLSALAWSAAGGSGAAPLGLGSGRYAQFRALLTANATATATPCLRRVRVGWPGEEKIVSFSGIGTRGPDYGVYEVSLDGSPLVRSVRLDLTIYQDILMEGGQMRRITSSMIADIDPRNTGK
jgi:type II secretory pathway component PulJ